MIGRPVLPSVLFLVSSMMACPARGQEGSQAPQLPPARNIPGITVEDPYPNACVDCHINYPEMAMDTRFSTLIKAWAEQVNPNLLAKAQASAPEGLVLAGQHPDVTSFVTDIPSGCLSCHAEDSVMAPPFGKMMHRIHLTGGEENHFLTIFQGECTFCHKLDAASGSWAIPSAAEH